MSKPSGVPKKILSNFGTHWSRLEKSIKKYEIPYIEHGGNFILSISKKEAFEIIDEYEDNLLAKKYDYFNLLLEMKENLLNRNQLCNLVGCKLKDYDNVITYLSMKYPIYEEDDERVGLLTI